MSLEGREKGMQNVRPSQVCVSSKGDEKIFSEKILKFWLKERKKAGKEGGRRKEKETRPKVYMST